MEVFDAIYGWTLISLELGHSCQCLRNVVFEFRMAMLKYNQEDAILFLVFNRVDTTSRVFESIRRAAPKRLYLAADGPRNKEESDRCEAVRATVSKIDWDCEVKTLFRDENLGCKLAVSGAISWFFDQEERGIILEDDCLPTTSFFGFCSELLEFYKDDDRVGHISGSNVQNGILRGNGSYYFSSLPNIWGWASWKRAWKNYDVEMSSFTNLTLSDLEKSASFNPYKEIWMKNFEDTYKHEIDTWDYQYSYFTFVHHYLSITPNQNLVRNIGFGADATHTIHDHPFSNLDTTDIDAMVHPFFFLPDVAADLYAQERQAYHPPGRRKNVFSRLWKGIKGR